MKKLLLFVCLLPLWSMAQTGAPTYRIDAALKQGQWYRIPNTSSSPIFMTLDSLGLRIIVGSLKMDSLGRTTSQGGPYSFLMSDSLGSVKSWPLDTIKAHFDVLTQEVDPVYSASPAFGISSGDITSWDSKLNISDTSAMLAPYAFINDTFPSGVIMTTSAATTAISDINNNVNGKVPQNRTLTINGTGFDLSANRVWTLTTADISESGNLYFTNARSRSAISLTTTGTSGAATYNSSTGVFNIPNYATSGTVSSVGLSSSDLSVSGSPIATSGNITANLTTTGASAGTYNSSYTVDNKGRITAAQNASFNPSPGRSLSTNGSNNTFTISTTRNARVTYTVNFSYSLTLTTSNGFVSLDYSTDGGSDWIPVASVSNAYTLAVTLSGNTDNVLSGEIPANALVRIYRSANTNVTVTLKSTQQEVLY